MNYCFCSSVGNIKCKRNQFSAFLLSVMIHYVKFLLSVVNGKSASMLTKKQYVDTLCYNNDKLLFDFNQGNVLTISDNDREPFMGLTIIQNFCNAANPDFWRLDRREGENVARKARRKAWFHSLQPRKQGEGVNRAWIKAWSQLARVNVA